MITNVRLSAVIVVIICIVLIAFLIWKVIDNYLSEKYSPGYCSRSIEDSKIDNKFIKAAKPAPSELHLDSYTIKIKECWIEERTQVLYKYLFFKRDKKLGSYYLCITLNNDIAINGFDRSYRFWREGSKYGFAKSKGVVYYDELTPLDVSQNEVRVALIKNESPFKKEKKVSEIVLHF